MVEPVAVARMDPDERQELKEAICDAILERTRRLVSGTGDYGQIILGDRPYRVLSSGFILPRLNVDGDDESSDIRIATHGMDLRIRMDAYGVLRISPFFHVYVRAMPSAQELFARNGRLIPPADFSISAKQQLRDQIRARMQALPSGLSRAARAAAQETAAREVMQAMGVAVPDGARILGTSSSEDADDAGSGASSQDVRTRLRIPNAISRRYEVPQKWVRVGIQPPPLELTLPCDPEAWRRAALDFKAVLEREVRAACELWINSPDGRQWAWRPIQVPSEAFWEPAAWEAFIAQARAIPPDPARLIPPIDIQVLADPLSDALNPAVASLRIALENLREQDDERECGAFGVELHVQIPDAALISMRLERVRRSYHLAGFLSMSAVGVNGGVEDEGFSGDGTRSLRTTWMPRYVLPRMRATTIESVPTSYEALANQSTDVNTLAVLPVEMLDWIGTVDRDTRLFWPGEEGTPEDEAMQNARFRDDLDAWRREAARVRHGVDLLVRSQAAWNRDPNSLLGVPYRAWLLLNRTFANANPRTADVDPGWRLFQLAFVLAHLPTLASRVPGYEGDFYAAFDEDAASLLYMSTGGGKTEAFFGVIVFAMFLDRLRGKRRGVTAMMHYPLRLLTIQQAQRLARLLAHAERVRRADSIAGAAFEIGFWVGGSNTPNRTESQAGRPTPEVARVPTWSAQPISREQEITDPDRGDKAYIAARDAWNKLPFCPFCGRLTGLRLYPERHHRLGIVCTGGADCPWNREHLGKPAPEPLPFLLVDTDIYRRAPTVLLGTIDKLALVGQNTYTIQRIVGMFGMARFLENGDDGLLLSPDRDVDVVPRDSVQLSPAWADGRRLFFDPFPSLIVQDEMHLLDESLGTFGGVFETSLFSWFGRLSVLLADQICRVPGAPDRPRLPHVIGATATASDAAKHVSALYQRQVIQFPHPGPSLHGGFYVRLSDFRPGSDASAARTEPVQSADVHPREKEASAPWARVYASLMTNGRLHTVTTLSVLAAHAATITRWLRDLGCGDNVRQLQAAGEIRDNVSSARWADRRRAAVTREITSRGFDRLAALVDLHRIELTYVTNKKGGDQILSAIEGDVFDAHEAMGPNYLLDSFTMELISGGIDVKGIQSVIQCAEMPFYPDRRPFDPMRDDVSGVLRGIVATSAISHGVDVETFNAMTFAGMPSDIAEYIQASSRVGRTHVGFSLLIPTPQARRDRFVTNVHESFHRLLERMIAPPAIERWADRALERTIPSLVQTWLAGVHYQQLFAAAPSGTKSSVRFPGTVEAVNAVFSGARGPTNFDDCVAFVHEAMGLAASVGGPGNSADYYRDLVRDGVDAVRREIGNGDFAGSLMDFWENDQNPLYSPMKSLRDVDEAGRIHAAGLTLRNRPLNSTDLAAAMAFLRNRGVSRGRRTASSETDSEE